MLYNLTSYQCLYCPLISILKIQPVTPYNEKWTIHFLYRIKQDGRVYQSKLGLNLTFNIKLFFFACWVIFHALMSSADFSKLTFFHKRFQEHCQSVKKLGSRSTQWFRCCLDLGPICLQRLSADYKSHR